MSYNGAAVVAMAGKDCVAIASDKRYGIRNQTVGAPSAASTAESSLPLGAAASRAAAHRVRAPACRV